MLCSGKADGLPSARGLRRRVASAKMVRKASVQSIMGTSDERLRTRLLESGVMRVAGETVVFDKDHLFTSPSSAAVALLGRTANGWIEWKSKDGKTLDALKRQPGGDTD